VRVSELWRYPVKSMGGEQLMEAELGPEGIPGDRLVHVEDQRGRVVTSRSKPRLLLHHATLGPDGAPRVDGRHWTASDVAKDVERAAGADARLVRDEGLDRFDVLPLLVATDGAIASLGYDRRRFRPNILLGDVPGLAERDWEGGELHIGEAVIGIVSLRQRCIMTTFDPDTAEQDVDVLLRIHRELGGSLALNCEVLRPGKIRIGDAVKVLPAQSGPGSSP
jgi:MOSC domain-containing protein